MEEGRFNSILVYDIIHCIAYNDCFPWILLNDRQALNTKGMDAKFYLKDTAIPWT